MVGRDIERGTLICRGHVDRDVELWALHASRRLPGSEVSAFLRHLSHMFPYGTSEELAALMEASRSPT